jgi:hypothetical protein
MPIINKPKHPKKDEYKEQNGRTHVQENKKTTYEGNPQKDIKFPNPIPLRKSMSNRERRRVFERTFSLKIPSPMAPTHFKIKIDCACYNVIDTLCL